MLNNQNIICLASIDWDFNWQGHQEIMKRLAQAGNRVLFVENTGIRALRLKDLPRLRLRWRNWRRGTYGIREVGKNLFVYSPLILPFPYARWASAINRWLCMAVLRPWLKALDFRDPIVWTFLPTRLALTLADALEKKLLVYYCIADFESLHPNPKKIRRYEKELILCSDLVFAQGEQLRARCARWNPHVSIFPFGVDSELFESSLPGVPSTVEGLSKPVLGYVGGLHRHLDMPLLKEVARMRPDWSFVLVGPHQERMRELKNLPNVHLLGPKPHEEIPAYVRGFDVCLIPYHLNSYTDTVYPTKLTEYLILGKPVVSTPLPEVVSFNARFGSPVAVASNAENFVRAVDHALGDGSSEEKNRRRQIARQFDWGKTVSAMCQQIARRLEALESKTPFNWPDQMVAVLTRARRRAGRILFATGAGVLLMFHTPLIWWLAQPLKVQASPRPADAIVVFAGGVGESGQADQGHAERVGRAVELFRQGWSGKLVFSSGYVYRYEEPFVMKALAIQLGIPPQQIFLETQARNTYENVRNSHEMIRLHGWDKILLVSSPYHMRRALWVWKKVGPETTVIPTPVLESEFYHAGGQIRLRHWKAILHEYMAILYYRWKGFL